MEIHGGAMGAVLGALGDCGYGFAYRVLDASGFGVAQQRRRVFIVGCLGDGAAPAEILLEPEGGGGDAAPWRPAGAGAGRSAAPRTGSAGRLAYALTAHGRRLDLDTETFVTDEAAGTVRRLTPLEYERLQGYPDGWTGFSGGRRQADGPRYKQLGNSFAVPVVEWIARRIVGHR